MHYVTEATYISAHTIELKFENGEIRIVDLAPHLNGPIFRPLKEPSFFKNFIVNPDIDTIAWPNDADFSPDFLYEIGQPASERK